MKRKIKQQLKRAIMAVAGLVSTLIVAAELPIQYAAEGRSGVYCGTGYGVIITVATPLTGATIKYSETGTDGTWVDEAIAYKDVCTDKPIYFQISAEGYETVVDSRNITVTPKTLTFDYVWLFLPSSAYVYDGIAKCPDFSCVDGAPSIISKIDIDISYINNVNAGTATAIFTGKGNYTGTVTEDFEILKADNEWTTEPSIAGWTYAQSPSDPVSAAKSGTATVTYGPAANPGSLGASRPTMPGEYVATFTVSESQNYNALVKDVPFTISPATINYAAEGRSGVYCGTGYGVIITVATPSTGATIKYSETGIDGTWVDEAIAYKDVCTDKPIYFQILAEGYETVVDSRNITVTPKTLTFDYVWLFLPSSAYVYDGIAKCPDFSCVDGAPSIISKTDIDISYINNVNAGTATAIFTGKGNYTGTVTEDFEILKADINGGVEPGEGEVPDGGLSKYDVTVMYDGKGHTINTNALFAVMLSGVVPGFEFAADENGPWGMQPPVYTNVCATSVWYKITAANYNDYVHEAKLTISPRTGVVVDIVGSVATNMFDNAQQTVSGYQVSINDSLYSESDFEFAGSDTISKISAGVYPMGLSSTQFVNTNVNFAEVAFNVTDGELVILAPPEKNVVFDALGGFSVDGKSVVTQRCDAVYGEMPVVTREGYCFEGWYLGVTNAAPEAIARSELLVDDAHTLFARWRIDESVMSGGEAVFKWEAISSDAVRILGFENSSQMVEVLVLPDTIEGMPVAEIAAGAFANSKCGMRKLILPIFCTKIGDKAFNGVSSLAEVNFADVRQWNAPSLAAELAIGRYAFSGASVAALLLPASVEEIGDYAFANCKFLSSITILGQPEIGLMPLRRSGMNIGGVVVHLDPALANDSAYMDSLKQECASVTVRADAVVNSIELSSLSLAADEVSLLVSVEKAASWGSIDSSAIKVSFRASLSDEPIMLDPILVVENDDGSLTVKVASPGGESGFFQVVYLK